MVAPFAGTFWDTSALATCTRNFPAERGTIIGIVKACMGAPCNLCMNVHEPSPLALRRDTSSFICAAVTGTAACKRTV